MRLRDLAALGVFLAAGAALAAPVAESPRPVQRPSSVAPAAPDVMRAATGLAFALPAAPARVRPAPRPEVDAAQPALAAAPAASPRPEARRLPSRIPRRSAGIAGGPEVIRQAAFRAPQASGSVTGRTRGLCGDPAILGKPIPPILGKAKGCGLEDGVSVIAVAGVALSQPANVDCQTARALKDWVEGGVKPAVGRKGGGVAALRIAGSYSCRPRNNQKGNRVSEHGRGRAVDITAIVLADGSTLSVLKGWGTRAAGKTLASARKAACGPFNTVLGPGSDRFHHDHFHLDTARGRGPYCR